jgi:hypothetical protein
MARTADGVDIAYDVDDGARAFVVVLVHAGLATRVTRWVVTP